MDATNSKYSIGQIHHDYFHLVREKRLAGVAAEHLEQDAFAIVFEKSKQSESYDELIGFILTNRHNWRFSDGDAIIEPFAKMLILKKDLKRYIRLKNIMFGCHIFELKNALDTLKKEDLQFDLGKIPHIDVSEFNVHDQKAHSDKVTLAAYHQKSALNGIDNFIRGLQELDGENEIAKINSLAEKIKTLKFDNRNLESNPPASPSSSFLKLNPNVIWDRILPGYQDE
jgi:hypothetical protein